MKARHVQTLFLAFVTLTVILAPQAQERTAAGATETQMNWSTLNTKVTSANTKADAVNTRVDQVVVCGRKGMVYAPGQAGADAQGCIVSKLDSTYVNMLNDINSNITNINSCAANGSVYNRSAHSCSPIKMPDPATLNIGTYNQTLCVRGGTHTVVSSCPGGQRLLGCGGGPGDQDESHEYWVLMPDFAANRCIGYVGNPRCYDDGWSRTIVSAVCYRP
ncbi:hypothetical protein O9X90_25700 [Agrobacterium leguminum]|uniref:hypothetical protein n=1 Tax=Agrobacterium leguminum TaxID=2792015 RepID=UPI0022B82091|nr:hypothetical protein [Agrobacterium leguminum]MCZ7935726.1 hypothetical protein [Agrobacterium leguminum]